jgi:hypothetical protein
MRPATSSVLGVLVLFLAVSARAPAQCGGNGGAADLVVDALFPGANAVLTLSGGAGQGFGIFYSDAVNPAVIPGVGPVCLDLTSPLFALWLQGVLSPSGTYTVPLPLPPDPMLIGILIYLQAGVTDPSLPGGLAISPALRAQVEASDSYAGLPPLSSPRALAPGVLMGDGRVLLCGGGDGTLLAPVGTSGCEIFDPVLRTLTVGPPMGSTRALQTVTRLPDGRVLVAGGIINAAGTVGSTCEIFDPWTGTWSPAGSMNAPRAGHVATALQDGRVLVCGGTTTFGGGTTNLGPILNGSQNTGEVYDPSTNTWTPVGNAMASARLFPSIVTLPDGRGLVMSGLNGAISLFGLTVPTWTRTCTFYDPASNLFSAAAQLPSGSERVAGSAAVLQNGLVWLAGGAVSSVGVPTSTATTRLFDGTVWAPGPSLPVGVTLPGIATLSTGRIFLCGGVTGDLLNPGVTAQAMTYDGTTLTPATSLPAASGLFGITPLKDGKVFLAGGSDGVTATTQTAVYVPAP